MCSWYSWWSNYWSDYCWLSWSKCRYFNTAASHELMLPLGHCPNRHFLKYAALILIFHSIAQ
ncbi:hypothetical protein BTN44_11960 [Staphylococcus aureus]|nr:hypothetical protein BTN44_11960 [Staphylococcus aureus]